MIIKTVMIDFASSKLKAIDCLQDLYKSVEHANWNLAKRHVKITNPRIENDKLFVVDVNIPDDASKSFRIGNSLKGISIYLNSINDGKYKKYKIGTRLLHYLEMKEVTI